MLTTEKRNGIKFWLDNPYAKLRGKNRSQKLKDNNTRTESKKFYLKDSQVWRNAIIIKRGGVKK
jgi:hypothetical protein